VNEHSVSPGNNHLLLIATALIVLVNLFIALGDIPPGRIQEVRVAETAREMLGQQEWLVPTFNGELRLQKPPLAYWLAMVGYQLGGDTNEWSLRFLTALVSVWGLGLLFRWVYRVADAESASCTVLCLASAMIPLKMMRVAETDPLLMASIIAGCFCAYQLIAGTDRRWILGLYTAMGVGALAKGPPGLIIPLAVFVVSAWQKNPRALKALWSPTGIAVCLLLTVGWYVYIYQNHSEQLIHTILKESDDTYLHGDHKQPFYYYFTRGFGYYAPWSLLVPSCTVWLYRQRKFLPLHIYMAVIWFVLVFVLLAVNANKQAHYSMLLAPSFAMLIGHYLCHSSKKMQQALQIFYAAIITGCAAYGIRTWIHLEAHTLQYVIAAILLLFLCIALLRVYSRRIALVALTAGSVALAMTLDGLDPVNPANQGDYAQKAIAINARNTGYQPLYFYGEVADGILFYAHGPIPVLPDPVAVGKAVKSAHKIYLFVKDGIQPTLPTTYESRAVLVEKNYQLLQISINSQNNGTAEP
jgi:4-amino-4-deoxy-L-arabinose transferase-like glycosyltransferase